MDFIFNFNDQQLRHVMIDGEPWFAASDVCRCLNIHIYRGKPNAKDATLKLDADERGIAQIATSSVYLTARKTQAAIIVSESGLYKLIMRSDKPEAKEFQNWVTKVVLPSIRKTGGYLLNEHARQTAHADTRENMPMPSGIIKAPDSSCRQIGWFGGVRSDLRMTLKLQSVSLQAFEKLSN